VSYKGSYRLLVQGDERTTTVLARELGDGIDGWADRLTRRLEGLDDEEHLWEPVDGCWSVRCGADGTWRPDLGPKGTPWTPSDPPPVTTIAWRLWHIGASPRPGWPPTAASSALDFSERWWSQGAHGGEALGNAREAVDAVTSHWKAVAALIRGFDDEELLVPMGEVAGPYEAASVHGLLLHIADELIHHSAEVALLRDLYRARTSWPA
jgi:hypothetical protein